ncbi:MAG: fused MFS/spermidine synthase [Elusimicrobia bacterium]|nr:fused MFS/spermidine synthase [Elusimicrobiota bacterium]
MRLILASTFLAGAAALVYEVLWVRLVTLSLGHTAPAVAAVLSAFMGGLAAGSWLGGRAADRRSPAAALRLYALIELAAAAAALASRPALEAASRAALAAGIVSLPPAPQAAAAFALSAAVLLLPAALLGASLPLLMAATKTSEAALPRDNARSRAPDEPLAALYGVNTLGAVLGCLACGLWLLPAFGLRRALLTGAALDVVAAGLAWAAARRLSHKVPSSPAPGPGPAVPTETLVLLAVTGAAAMACETAWTRAIAMLAGSTTYAFTAVLSLMLAGLALGSLTFSRRRRDSGAGLAALLSVLGLAVTAGLAAYDYLPFLLVRATGGAFPALSAFGFTALVVGPPAFLMGAILPWLAAMAAPENGRLGRAVGALYSANTAGAILGSAAAGLALLPLLGWRGTLAACAVLYAAAAAFLLARAGRRAAGAAALVPILLAAGSTRGNPRVEASGMFLYAPYYTYVKGYAEFVGDLSRDRVIFHETGPNATTTVLESPHGERFLRINGKTDASEGGDMTTQLLLGYLPRLWGPPAPRRALVVGLGAGLTASALAGERSLASLEVLEIEPAVARAAALFARSNRAVLDDPRLRLILADARQFLASPGPRYDLIVSEPSNPWIAGVAYLFTREAFALARRRLETGGVFCQWFHSYHMREEDFKLVVRTFRSEFPHSVLLYNGEADYFLLGSESPLAPDYARFESAFRSDPAFKDDMSRLARSLDDPFTLLVGTFVLGDEDLGRWAGDGPLHEDDRPTLETDAPRSFHRFNSKSILTSLNASKSSYLPPGVTNIVVRNAHLSRLFSKAAETVLDSEEPSQASDTVARALQLDPRSARAWTAYGRLLDVVGRDAEAAVALRKGASLAPDSAEARARLGIFLYGAGRPKEGKPELEAARRLMPGHPLACLGLGWMALEAGDLAGARLVLAEGMSYPIPELRLRSDLANALKRASAPAK